MQTRRQSMVEVCSSTSIGFVGSWLITYAVFANVREPALAATTGVVLCTLWSLVRGYAIRRHFSTRERVQ